MGRCGTADLRVSEVIGGAAAVLSWGSRGCMEFCAALFLWGQSSVGQLLACWVGPSTNVQKWNNFGRFLNLAIFNEFIYGL